ncbi:unnamed protein product [Sphenostylis stenocarpa]|uniref:Uncharacterized protein n=1 Tax=Sphenostylis stenocarpa TaxID=92480 RepID=A0AA86RL17_9FABA|nr:unnamed protein product [Sphenostylis stenocarpa]
MTATRVYENRIVGVSIGFAAELFHPVESEQDFAGEALFSEDFDDARDGGGGNVKALFEEVPEEFDCVGAGEETGQLAARISVGRGAQDEDIVAELVVFEVEVALPQRCAVAEAALPANGARRLEGVAGDGVENLCDGIVCPWRRFRKKSGFTICRMLCSVLTASCREIK